MCSSGVLLISHFRYVLGFRKLHIFYFNASVLKRLVVFSGERDVSIKSYNLTTMRIGAQLSVLKNREGSVWLCLSPCLFRCATLTL